MTISTNTITAWMFAVLGIAILTIKLLYLREPTALNAMISILGLTLGYLGLHWYIHKWGEK